MNKIVKYILAILAAAAAVVYFFIAFVFVDKKEKSLVCTEINVIENNSSFVFIDKDEIKSELQKSGQKIIGSALDSIDTYKLKEILKKNNRIKTANIYTTVDGKLNVDIEQRRPILRIQCSNAKFYIDESGYMFPMAGKTDLQIPIVTGTLQSVPANGFVGYVANIKNDSLLNNLYKFAMFLRKNKYWNSMIEQININGNNEIEIIPQIAQHIVVLGNLSDFESKLKKLNDFYTYAMPTIGWNKYKTINLKYRNQIICKTN